MTSFSTDKQRDKVNAEWMSRPVDDRQPLALVLISMEQSLTFAYRLKRKLLSGPIFGGAYSISCMFGRVVICNSNKFLIKLSQPFFGFSFLFFLVFIVSVSFDASQSTVNVYMEALQMEFVREMIRSSLRSNRE